MSSAYQIEIIFLKEFIYNLVSQWRIKGNSVNSVGIDVQGRNLWVCVWLVCLIESGQNFTSAPNVKLTPRSFSPQPIVSLSGSDHNRSHSKPWSGTSVGRMIRRICSIEARSGLSPPWHVKIFSSTVKGKKATKQKRLEPTFCCQLGLFCLMYVRVCERKLSYRVIS